MKYAQGSRKGYAWLVLLASFPAMFLTAHTLRAAPQSPAPQIIADESAEDELSEEEIRQIKTAERFLSILEKNPRRGTALDRVYGHHVEFGSLDAFLQSLRERTEQSADDGAAWMLLGLFESQRGDDGAAADAFLKAEQLRPQDALASYYLGQSQLRIGQSEEAVASFERGIERKPPRADLLEIYQQLGRVHQRAQRTDEALKVWQRLEDLFPDDPRVLEQIAVTLAEEGQPALALSRYEKLAQLVRDDYRRVMFQVTAAELQIKAGQRESGIAGLEAVLADLNPESWLYRDVRRRIDDVFLRSGDQDNLVKYYQRWLEAHPDDIEGMSRLARFLASSARVPEATQWMEKALKLAPSRTDLRKAFIDQLVNDQRFSEAIKQYEQLIEVAPGNVDFLRDWGKLVLRDKERPEDQRRAEAVRIWSQIVETRPDDALTVAQVADLYRQNNMADQAEQLYRKAVELAPADPQYREYLGEFLHIQKRPEEALVVWSGIAEGDRRNAVNMTRLAEVYNSFGFPEKAVVEIAEAVSQDPKDFALQLRAAEYHSRAGKFDEAIAYVASADALASSDDEHDAVIQQRIEVLQTSQRLDSEADRLAEQVRSDEKATSDQWYLLARYLEASRSWPDATDAIDNAIRLDPKSITALTAAARIAETSGDYGRAAETSRKLADIDRRSRGDHLMNVSRLEAQMGRADEALKAAQELIVSAPGNTDYYEFYAQTCFRLGKSEEGLEALRKAVRINPNEPHLIMALGSALAEQLRTDEAIEVYWRAFDKSDEVEDKVGLTMKLAPLYQQVNQFDKLVERFERDRREEDKRREMTICLAQAWHTTGDFGAARQELESLLSEDTRDTNLLNQLAKLCQDGADLEAAIGYQRQLVAIAPGHETEFPLAGMLMANRQIDEAREIFVKLTQREEDPVRQMKAIDSLLTQGNNESVIGVIEPLLAQQRDDWELLYREAVAWAAMEKTDEAKNRLERLLSLALPYDSLGRSAQAKLKQAQAKAKSDNLRGITSVVPQRQSPLAMRGMSAQVQQATGLTANNRYYAPGSTPPVWTPEAYGVARMAAYGWLLKLEDDQENVETQPGGQASPNTEQEAAPSLAIQLQKLAAPDDAPRNAIYDWLYVAHLKNDYQAIFDIARRLAKSGGSEEQRFFLSSLNTRHIDTDARRSSSNASAANKTPLSEDDLQLVRDCYAALDAENKNVDFAALYGGNVAYGSNGQVYVLMGGSYTMLPGVFRGEGGYLTLLIDELRLSGKSDEALELLNNHLREAESATELAGAMALLLKEERFDEVQNYYERWQQAAFKQIAEAPVTAPTRRSSRSTSATVSASVLPSALNTIQQWMATLGADEENAQVLSIMDSALNVAVAEAKHRRLVQAAQTRRNASAPSSSSLGRITVFYGKETIQSNLDFPPANMYIDRTAITLLRQVHEILQRNDVASDLVDTLRERLAAAEEASNDESLYEQLYLAAVLWWSEEQDEAVQLMANVAKQLPDDLGVRFDMAQMYESRGDYEDALLLIDSVTPRDQKVLQQRELAALRLAERLGDIDRARAAAERLFGLRLNAQTQLTLVDRMRRLGLSEMADAVLARVERTSSNQTSSLTSLMMLYQGQGKVDQANQLAHMLLRRTASPMSASSRSSRNPLRYSSSDSNYRNQALQLLQRSGALKTLIEQLEGQLERSPDSIGLLEQLIEFYGVTGQKEEAGEKLQQAIERRPDSAILRLQLAKHFEQTGKTSEACDQYLELMKLQPGWVTSELYQVERVFTQAKRKIELVKALSSLNLKTVSDPYYIANTASNLLREEENVDVAMTLLERAFDAFPQYRRYLVQNISDEAIWKNERFYQFAKRLILPGELDLKANPWAGIDEIDSYSSNGEVNVFFHRMLRGLKSTDRLADVEESIRELADRDPDWMGGQAMLALIELSSDRKDDARSRLQALIENEKVMKTIPAEACWIVGQELNRFDETRATAMTLFEKALEAPSQNSMNQIQYSPVVKLIEIYSKEGRKDDARDLLLKQVKSATFDNYDFEYASYQQIENTNWAAQKLLEMECPVDSIRLYRQLLDSPDKLAATTRYSGREPDYFEQNAKKGISKALSSMDESNTDDVITQLLSVPETINTGTPAVDLMLLTPDAKELSKGAMNSSYVELLVTLARDEATSKAIANRLAQISEQYPQDLSIAIASTAWQLTMEDAKADDSVRQLAVIVSDHPLEDIAEGRRPNSRQRREAAMLIPLWLVARECFDRKEMSESANQFGELALQAARRQVGIQEQSTILYEWGKILLEQGNKEEAEARWTELLDLATQRPQRSKKVAEPRASFHLPRNATGFAAAAMQFPRIVPVWLRFPVQSIAMQLTAQEGAVAAAQAGQPEPAKMELIPPLTLSQFRTAITVAKSAAEHGMSDLSRRAVSESLKGGFPVADPVAGDLNANASQRIFRSSSTSSETDPIETEVIGSVKEIAQIWEAKEFPDEDIYVVLKSLVLPANRPREIWMYVTVPDVINARVDSLAVPLVLAAKGSNRLAELLESIDQRSIDAATKTASTAMKTLIAIEQDDSDEAIERLNELTAQVNQGVPTNTMHIALLAALQAFEKDKLKAAAFPILRQTLQQELNTTAANRNRELSVAGKLPSLVNSYLASTGDFQAVKDYFESVLIGRQSYYSRYSGDYGLYQQWRDLGAMADQAADLNMPEIALDLIGRASDFDVPNYSPPNLSLPLALTTKHLRALSPAAQYEAWHTWTMPVEGRQTVRFLTEIIGHPPVSPAFLKQGDAAKPADATHLMSNFTELVSAAKEAGKLAELQSEVEPLVKEKIPDSEFLSTLILIAQNNQEAATQAVRELLESMTDRLKPGSNRRRPTAYGEYLVYQACLQSESCAELFTNRLPEFRKQLISASQSSLLPFLNADWFHRVTTGRRTDELPDSQLAHWLTVAASEASSIQPAWWSVYEDQIVHLSGFGADTLYFRYPLTGTFKVSIDCFESDWAECDAGYGGITVLSQQWGSTAPISSASGHETISRPGGMKRTRPGFNRVTIEVADGQMKYRLNNHLVYQEATSGTSPWLVLTTEGNRVTSFRNFQFEGSPVIPRSVSLFSDDRMDGWNCSTFNESQPRKRLMAETPENESDSLSYYQRNEPSVFDWSATDGVLEGLQQGNANASNQSWIYYQRPLESNESFQYEFYYSPGQTVAHPSIGRIALMLDPNGVTSHWIGTPQWDENYEGIPLNNAIVEATCRRGPEKLPLKPDDWNQVDLSLKGNAAVVSLNGTVVFERPIEPGQSTRFGIFRYKQQAAKVRNAILTGDWPTEVPGASGASGEVLTALTKPLADDVTMDIATIVNDAMIAPLAGEIVRKARHMQPEQAFEFLKDWVLPSASHRNIRTYYSLDAPAVDLTLESATQVDHAGEDDSQTSAVNWGHVLCPAAELVRVANSLGKLKELVAVLDSFKTDDPVQIRNQNALAALIAMESGDEQATAQTLKESWNLLIAGLPKELSANDRAAEFVVAWRAAQEKALRSAASDLVRELRGIERDQKLRSGDDAFLKQVNGLFGDIERVSRIASWEESRPQTDGLSQWTEVPYFKPELKFRGYRLSTWMAVKGSLQHIPAEMWSQLYFQSPLRGQFEVISEHSTHGHGEVSIAWGMHAAQPRYDAKAVRVTKVMHGTKDIDGEVKLPAWDQKAETRFQVDGNKVTTWTNGVKIHEETFGTPPDPWLVIQADQPTNYATVNNLRILGSPEIPSEINLIDMAGWAAWRADLFAEFHSAEGNGNAPWKRVDDELTGQLKAKSETEHLESLLLYQRPMLEDGVIEFESWYEPDKFEVHPALGPNAYLLRPDGVRRHRLTNAQYELSSLSPGNEEPASSSATEIPFKENDWNRIRLTLEGDRLTIAVNDTDVATVAVTVPSYDRQFGLFRYSNKTECRVRKLVYRGDWPKTLPSIDEQELASPAEGPFALSDAKPVFDERLNQPIEKLKSKGFATLGTADKLSVLEDGLHLSMHDSNGYPTWPGVIRRAKVDGDLQVTADYKDLELSPAKQGWGLGVGLVMTFADPETTRVECTLSLNKDDQLVYKTQLARTTAAGASKTHDHTVISNAPTSGRLRIVRRGGQAHCLVAEAGDAPFRLLASFAVGDTPIAGVAFSSRCSDSVAGTEITLERLAILAKQSDSQSPSPAN